MVQSAEEESEEASKRWWHLRQAWKDGSPRLGSPGQEFSFQPGRTHLISLSWERIPGTFPRGRPCSRLSSPPRGSADSSVWNVLSIPPPPLPLLCGPQRPPPHPAPRARFRPPGPEDGGWVRDSPGLPVTHEARAGRRCFPARGGASSGTCPQTVWPDGEVHARGIPLSHDPTEVRPDPEPPSPSPPHLKCSLFTGL